MDTRVFWEMAVGIPKVELFEYNKLGDKGEVPYGEPRQSGIFGVPKCRAFLACRSLKKTLNARRR